MQVVQRTVVDIEVDRAGDAVDAAFFGVLPKVPCAFVAEFLHFVVGDPKRIAVELGGVEIVFFERQIGVDDGRRAEAFFHHLEPFEDFSS